MIEDTVGTLGESRVVGDFTYDVCVVGGCGHVGLPLALAFARVGLRTSIYDVNDRAVETVRSGRMPFKEEGAEPILREVIGRSLEVANDPTLVTASRDVVVVIGTPVDEHLNATFHMMRRFFQSLIPYLVDGQCVILRSTVAPGTTEKIHALLEATGKDLRVAFCPERVAEGHALEEFATLPQIVSGIGDSAVAAAAGLFGRIAPSLLTLTPLEAELTKIFTNVWRYIEFATANQFLMIAADRGVEFYRVFEAMTQGYPRMAGLPRSGFAAGPCLFKDTMQLAAASDNNLLLGHAAMLINEGLPSFLVRRLGQSYPLARMCVGILGMAFKAESDDPRESLSYKLRKVLEAEAAEVLCTDVYINDPSFRPLDEVIARSDLLIIGAPHRQYRSIIPPGSTPLIDIWNLHGKGTSLS